MRALMVALLTDAIAPSLVRAAVGRWGPCGVGVQGPRQARMTAGLLGCARRDACREAPESAPLGRAWRQSGQRLGGPRHAVLGADTEGQAELLTQAGEDRCGLGHGGGVERPAGPQETPVTSGHGERSTGEAVAGVAMACKVRGPDLMGRAHADGWFPRMTDESAPGEQPVSAEAIAAGGAGRPGPWGPSWVPTHRRTLCPLSLDATVTHVSGLYPRRLIGDRADDSAPREHTLAAQGIALMAPHRRNRRRAPPRDGRPVRRDRRRWKIARLCAWLNQYQRVLTRWERCRERLTAFVQLALSMILLRRLRRY